MRVIYCVTLSFFLISHASRHVPTSSASPLPPSLPSVVHHRDVLVSSPQDLLNDEETHCVGCGHGMTSIACLNSELLDQPNQLPGAHDPTGAIGREFTIAASNLEEYPYPTTMKTLKRSRTKSGRHSSTRANFSVQSTSMAPGTLFVTASYAPAPSPSVHRGTLSPLHSLYGTGRSPMIAAVSPEQSIALPWVLGILIPITLVFSMCLGIRWNQKNKRIAVPQPIPPENSYPAEISELSTVVSSEKIGLGIRFEGAYNTSALLTLPPVSVRPLNLDSTAPITENKERDVQEMLDRFELKAAVFPTRSELSHYVFPATAATVEREVQAAKRAESEPPTQIAPFPLSSSIPRNLPTSRPLVIPAKRIVPKMFGSRIQAAQRKRFSPIGDVLYSTGGGNDPLETVHEEGHGNYVDVTKTPKAAYKGGEGGFASGPQNEAVPLASSTSYGILNSPEGLRARHKSSPMVPDVTFSDADGSPVISTAQIAVAVAPLQINKNKRLSPNHRRSATRSETLESTNILGKPHAPDADEEERKFTEFVRGLVWNAHARDRQSRRYADSVCSTIDLGVATMMAVKPDELGHAAPPMLLPAPSFGAALSDFGISSSTLASEVPSSSSRLSIGIAL